MKIKADKQMYDAWMKLTQELQKFGSVLEEDKEVHESDLIHWQYLLFASIEELEELATRIADHCRSAE